MAKEARERIRENREKGKDAVFEELKRFSAAMKLAATPTPPPEDILSVIGKGNQKEPDAHEKANNNTSNWLAYKTIFRRFWDSLGKRVRSQLPIHLH
jgi:hypothetical protein